MIDIIINKNPEAFYCPHCKAKIKPDDEKEEDYDEPMNYCEHVIYCFTSEGIDYLSPSAEKELNDKGIDVDRREGFVEINDPKDEDLGFQDLPRIFNSKNVENYRFSYASTWGLEVNLGISK